MPGQRARDLIIGIGDRLRGDDGAGPAVVDRLRKYPRPLPRGVELREHWGEGTALMAAWEGRRRVVVVDAVAPAGSPGAIHRFGGEKMPPAGLFHYSAHRFGLAEAVALARELDALPDDLLIYGIEGDRFNQGARLSAPVASATRAVVQTIVDEWWRRLG